MMADTGPRVEAFVFDLFGVIISFDTGIAYSRLARHCADPQAAFRHLEGLMASPEVVTDRVTLPQIHLRLVDELGLTMSFPEFEAAWLEPYSVPMPGMADLVATLARNHRLILLSNVDKYYWPVVRAMHPELDHFDALLVSCDLGMAKPDLEVFRHASQVAGAEPARCLFVDDTAANVAAARAVGLQAHLFRGTSQLVDELRAAGTSGL
jgi:HAD superfamily hydrolase (TIGR01509 family)